MILLYVLDAGKLVNTGLDANFIGDREAHDGLVLCTVHETSQGHTDLNGDGDFEDFVVRWFRF